MYRSSEERKMKSGELNVERHQVYWKKRQAAAGDLDAQCMEWSEETKKQCTYCNLDINFNVKSVFGWPYHNSDERRNGNEDLFFLFDK